MTAPDIEPTFVCGDCAGRFEASVAVFVLDALAPTLEQAPLPDPGRFDTLLHDLATKACSGILQGSSAASVAELVYCVAANHLTAYLPAAETEPAPDRRPCGRPKPAALGALGQLLVNDPETGLALLRRAADDFYDRR